MPSWYSTKAPRSPTYRVGGLNGTRSNDAIGELNHRSTETSNGAAMPGFLANSWQPPLENYLFFLVRGLERQLSAAWEAGALPFSYTREVLIVKGLVGLVGLEPTTSCSQSTRATKLRHSPIPGKGNSPPVLVTGDSYLRTVELEGEVLERVRTYESLSRWEKSELGRDLRRLGLSYGEIMELIPVKKVDSRHLVSGREVSRGAGRGDQVAASASTRHANRRAEP